LVGIFSIYNPSNEMARNHTLALSDFNKMNLILGLYKLNLLGERYYENL